MANSVLGREMWCYLKGLGMSGGPHGLVDTARIREVSVL